MMATRSLNLGTFGLPAGAWRWAALGFVFVALGAAGLAVAAPDAARWAGVALLGGIGAVGSLFLYAVWPREGLSAAEARLVAEAAARANVAWAVTGSDGAVLDSNDVYRRMAGAPEGEAPPPPELALAAEASSAMLYRLTRGAVEGRALEETLRVAAGIEIVAAVRPLGGGQAAWWFTPRLGHSQELGTARDERAVQPPPASLLRDAPVGIAIADAGGMLIEANRAFGDFFGGSVMVGRALAEFADAADREAVAHAIANAGGADAAPAEFHPAGQPEKMAELFASPIGNGDSKRVILYLVDISEQKRWRPNSRSRRRCRPSASSPRRRARFQQFAHRHHRQLRIPADAPCRGRPSFKEITKFTRTRCAPPIWCASFSPSRASRPCSRACWRCARPSASSASSCAASSATPSRCIWITARNSGPCMPTRRSFPMR